MSFFMFGKKKKSAAPEQVKEAKYGGDYAASTIETRYSDHRIMKPGEEPDENFKHRANAIFLNSVNEGINSSEANVLGAVCMVMYDNDTVMTSGMGQSDAQLDLLRKVAPMWADSIRKWMDELDVEYAKRTNKA